MLVSVSEVVDAPRKVRVVRGCPKTNPWTAKRVDRDVPLFMSAFGFESKVGKRSRQPGSIFRSGPGAA